MHPIGRAILSTYDKHGIVELAQGLARLGVEIVSTGGTARHLAEHGVPVTRVSTVTGFPEILGGRVKTLHPNVHGGILANRKRSSDAAELQEHGIQPVGLVVVNLYPFRETLRREDARVDELVEMIDIGGPTMLRAAAKNFHAVTPVCDPGDYEQVLAVLERGEEVPEGLRRRLAAKAFRHTQAYDAAISAWLESLDPVEDDEEGPVFPRHLFLDLDRELAPRYGENPHQEAAVYSTAGGPGVLGGFEQLQGKELSYNNLLDADAARKMVALFEEPAVVIVKHNNPCGVGCGDDLVEAYGRALATDPVSAFGSIVAVNRPLGADFAEAMADLFVEVVVAPEIDDAARELYAAKANLRVLVCPVYAAAPTTSPAAAELRAVDGGFLAQVADAEPEDASTWASPTTRPPSPEEREAMEFAWKVARYTKSNAIVVANAHQTLGIGAGQMSRVDSCRLALDKAAQAELSTEGAVAASDAFFPFRDGLDVLAAGGVTAIVQPGGSKRDDEVIAAADEQQVAMLFTGRRHFRH